MSGQGEDRISWAAGPVECASCARPMRPNRHAEEGIWVGTVRHDSHGLCVTCSKDAIRAARRQELKEHADPSRPEAAIGVVPEREGMRIVRRQGLPYVLLDWERPYDVPEAHCYLEAMADLADLLVTHGLIAVSEVTAAPAPYAPDRVTRLMVQVRMQTLSERDALKRPASEAA